MSTEQTTATQPLHVLEADAVVRAILQGTATEAGHDFFAALVRMIHDGSSRKCGVAKRDGRAES